MSQLSISQRGKNLQASPIRKLIPYAEKAKKNGVHVFHLNLGQPDILSPQVAIKEMQNKHIDILDYTHSAGNYSLREALSDYYKKNNVPFLPEEILITCGGSEALLNVFCCCLDAGDEIIIPEPFYTNYNFFSQVLDIKIVPITCTIENNFSLPKIEEFEKIITPKTKAIFINAPGNPTGIVYNQEELRSLEKIVLKHNLFLISDEVYSEFCYDGLNHSSAMSLTSIHDRVILIDSFSKKYSLTGIRVGSVATKNKALYETFLKFSQGRISPPYLGQMVAEYALKLTPTDYLINMKIEYQKRRDLLFNALKKINGVTVAKPNGAFYCMAKLPIDDAEIFCKWLLDEFSYNNQTIMISPAAGFYATPNLGKQEVRIAYVLNEQDLSAAMDCLDKAIEFYNKKLLFKG